MFILNPAYNSLLAAVQPQLSFGPHRVMIFLPHPQATADSQQ